MIARALHGVVASSMGEDDRRHWAIWKHDHLKCCSCWMCGNPRKWYGDPTWQERRRIEDDARKVRGGLDGE
jgi:hypothetical protein